MVSVLFVLLVYVVPVLLVLLLTVDEVLTDVSELELSVLVVDVLDGPVKLV